MLDKCSRMHTKKEKWVDAKMSLCFFPVIHSTVTLCALWMGLCALNNSGTVCWIDYVLRKIGIRQWYECMTCDDSEQTHFYIHNLAAVSTKDIPSWSVYCIDIENHWDWDPFKTNEYESKYNRTCMETKSAMQRPHVIAISLEASSMCSSVAASHTLDFGWLLIEINARYVSLIN